MMLQSPESPASTNQTVKSNQTTTSKRVKFADTGKGRGNRLHHKQQQQQQQQLQQQQQQQQQHHHQHHQNQRHQHHQQKHHHQHHDGSSGTHRKGGLALRRSGNPDTVFAEFGVTTVDQAPLHVVKEAEPLWGSSSGSYGGGGGKKGDERGSKQMVHLSDLSSADFEDVMFSPAQEDAFAESLAMSRRTREVLARQALSTATSDSSLPMTDSMEMRSRLLRDIRRRADRVNKHVAQSTQRRRGGGKQLLWTPMSLDDHGSESFVPFFTQNAESTLFSNQLNYQSVKVAEVMQITADELSPNPFVTNVITSVLVEMLPLFARLPPVAATALALAFNSAFAHQFSQSAETAISAMHKVLEATTDGDRNSRTTSTDDDDSAPNYSGKRTAGVGTTSEEANASQRRSWPSGSRHLSLEGSGAGGPNLMPLSLPVPDLSSVDPTGRLLASQPQRLTLLPSLQSPSTQYSARQAGGHSKNRSASSIPSLPKISPTQQRTRAGSDETPVLTTHASSSTVAVADAERVAGAGVAERRYALTKAERRQWKKNRRLQADTGVRHLGATIAAAIRTAASNAAGPPVVVEERGGSSQPGHTSPPPAAASSSPLASSATARTNQSHSAATLRQIQIFDTTWFQQTRMHRRKFSECLDYHDQFAGVLKRMQIKRKGQVMFTQACLRRWQLSLLFWCFKMLKKNAARSRGSTRLMRYIHSFHNSVLSTALDRKRIVFDAWRRFRNQVRARRVLEKRELIDAAHERILSAMSTSNARTRNLRLKLAKLTVQYNEQVAKMAKCEELLQDPAREPTLLLLVYRELTFCCTSMVQLLVNRVGAGVSDSLPRGRPHDVPAGGFLRSTLVDIYSSTMNSHSDGDDDDDGRRAVNARESSVLMEVPTMLCKDCSSAQTRADWLQFVGSTASGAKRTVSDDAWNAPTQQTVAQGEGPSTQSQSPTRPPVVSESIVVGAEQPWDPVAPSRRQHWRIAPLLCKWLPFHRTLRQHDKVLELWQHILVRWTRVYLLTLVDQAPQSCRIAFVREFGSSVAEAHRLDVFLDRVLMTASAAKLWGMMLWLRKAVALAGDPLTKDHLIWPLTDTDDANFKYARHIVEALGYGASTSLIDVLCDETTYANLSTRAATASRRRTTEDAASVVGGGVAHIRVTVDGRECIVTPDYRQELQWVLMSHILARDVSKMVEQPPILAGAATLSSVAGDPLMTANSVCHCALVNSARWVSNAAHNQLDLSTSAHDRSNTAKSHESSGDGELHSAEDVPVADKMASDSDETPLDLQDSPGGAEDAPDALIGDHTAADAENVNADSALSEISKSVPTSSSNAAPARSDVLRALSDRVCQHRTSLVTTCAAMHDVTKRIGASKGVFRTGEHPYEEFLVHCHDIDTALDEVYYPIFRRYVEYVEDRRRIPELMTVVGHLSWLGMSQVVLASDVALVGQANSTYQAFEPSESAIQRMLMFFCGRWPPKEVIESATREVHEVIGRHSNSISRLFNRLRARSFHARPVGKKSGASSTDNSDDLNHDDETEGISHTMLWLFVLRTGILHAHQAHISAVDVDNFFAVVNDAGGASETAAVEKSSSDRQADGASSMEVAPSSGHDDVGVQSERPEELDQPEFLVFIILLSIKIYSPELFLHAKAKTARVQTPPISAACSQFLQDDIAKGSVHDNLVLREIEQSSIQEYLWHNSRVTAGVFCTYCARDGNAVSDHPQLRFDDCLKFLDDLFPPRSEPEEVVVEQDRTTGESPEVQHSSNDDDDDGSSSPATTKKSETVPSGLTEPVSRLTRVRLSRVDKIAMFLAAAGEADRAMALVQDLRLVELTSVEALNPTQRHTLLEAERFAREKQLVFFEFEELLVGLAMIVTPHRRVVSTHAVEVLYDEPGGLRDLGDKLARTYQMLHELPCVGIEGTHKGSRLHAILTRTSGIEEVTTDTNDEAHAAGQPNDEPCDS